MKEKLLISLVIPVFNEIKTIDDLIASIKQQTRLPDEVIFVDGGSTDGTIKELKRICENQEYFKLITVPRAMPGKGRNIGTQQARYDWIAYTDGGIKLDKTWLQELEIAAQNNRNASIVYGNYSPITISLFEKCAAITYVGPLRDGLIRGKFIASSMFKKEVWQKADGFPDWRAAEDLELMEKAEQLGYTSCKAPAAKVSWQLRQTFWATYKRFDLYSKYNIWAARQSDWHYGVLRLYLIKFAFLLLGFFHHWLWFSLIPLLVVARAMKRTWMHRFQFGRQSVFNPQIITLVVLHILTMDAGTFTGWIKALLRKSDLKKPSTE